MAKCCNCEKELHPFENLRYFDGQLLCRICQECLNVDQKNLQEIQKENNKMDSLKGGICEKCSRDRLMCQCNVKHVNDIEKTLEERGSRYGKFVDHATLSQHLLGICKGKDHLIVMDTSWERMEDYQKEALTLIMHKVARILNGDPHYADSWHDIAGYAELVVKELEKDND